VHPTRARGYRRSGPPSGEPPRRQPRHPQPDPHAQGHRVRHPSRVHSCQQTLLRRPIESGQYTSGDYTQTLTDHLVLGSIGTVGDAYDNALAESFVDSYKTELISDRVWRSRAEVELATVEWVAWFNHDRLHSSLGDMPPVEFEALHAPNPADLSVAAIESRVADGPTTSHVAMIGVDLGVDRLISPENALVAPSGFAQAAPTAVKGRKAAAGLSDLRCRDIPANKNIKTNKQQRQEST